MTASGRPGVGRAFLVIWGGQLVSAVGSSLGSFAVGVWVYQRTASATQFALIMLFGTISALSVAPLAGKAADTFDRRHLLIAANLISAAAAICMAAALAGGWLPTWSAFPFVVIMAGLASFQGPALMAAISQLVAVDQLARANGMSQASQAIAQIIGPLLAGVLIAIIGFGGVILIDCCTFLLAAWSLTLVRIPRPLPAAGEEAAAGEAPRQDGASSGWRFIRERPGLLALMMMYAVTNFSLGMVQVLLTPLVLSFASMQALGVVSSVAAAGALAGAGLLTAWGGPRRRIGAILACLTLQGLLVMAAGLRADVVLIAAAAAAFMFTVPFDNGCNSAIWQSKVAHHLQGRVFAVRQVVAFAATPLAYLISGPLADRLFVPLLRSQGALAGSVGRLIGVGPGRGIGLLLIVLGAATLASVAWFASNPRLRRVESELPDVAPPRLAVAAAALGAATPEGAF
jgi:DHA3 family macrolide efflux protein-like MFS transporter